MQNLGATDLLDGDANADQDVNLDAYEILDF